MVAYTKLESEDQLSKDYDKEVKKFNWPEQGEIQFNEATMRYRPNLPPAIKDVTFLA